MTCFSRAVAVPLLSAALASATGTAHAQSRSTVQASEMARRLDVLAKLVSQYSSFSKSLGQAGFAGNTANVLRGRAGGIDTGVGGMHAAVASGILSRNLSTILDRQAKEADAVVAALGKAAQDARSSDGASARSNLDAIVAPRIVVDLFTTTTSGEALPTPPHLEGGPAPQYSLGDFVVGPGSNATVAYPSVASINYRFEGLGSSTMCTGTLVSASYVLTAAHCFCDLANANDAAACRPATYLRGAERLSPFASAYVSVFFQDAGVRSVKRIEIDPAYVKPAADLAVLELSTPLDGIAPAPLEATPAAGVLPLGVVVGFGQHGRLGPDGRPRSPAAPIANSQGIKMFAYVKPERCKGREARGGLVCWRAVRTAGGEALGTTCHGDSGGPLFTEVAGRWIMTGVTSFGPEDCGLGGRDDAAHQSVDVSVGANIAWIRRFVKPSGTPSSPGNPFVADPAGRVYGAKYRVFFDAFDDWSDTFVVAGARSSLSVAVNGNPTFSKLGVSLVPPAAGSAACRHSTADAAVVCDIPHPAPGKWKLVVSGSRPQETQVVGSVVP